MSINNAKKAVQIKQAISSRKLQSDYGILTKFASAEHLSHILPYELGSKYDPKLPLVVIDDDGVVREYQATPISSTQPGIVGYILTGVAPNNNRVHVVFRGTYDTASIVRDLEHSGAGQLSFAAARNVIVSQIKSAIAKQTPHKVNLSISGHSLGGADAQNCATAILQEMADIYTYKIQDPLTQIESVTVNHANSAGVTINAARSCKSSAQLLSKHEIKINVRALKAAGDGLQQTGQTNILSDVPKDVAHVEVLKINRGYAGWMLYVISKLGNAVTLGLINTFNAHSGINFDKPLADRDFSLFDNSTESGAAHVKKELRHKTVMDNNFISHGVKKLLHKTSSLLITGNRTAQNLNVY